MLTKIPGPRGRWLVGDMPDYLADRIGWLRDSRPRYGDVVRLAPGTLVAHHPSAAHEVLARTNDTYLLETSQLGGRRQRAAQAAGLERWMLLRRTMWRGVASRLAADGLDQSTAEAAALVAAHVGGTGELLGACRAITGRLIVDFCLGGDPRPDFRAGTAARADQLFTKSLAALVDGESRRRFSWRPLAAAARRSDAELRGVLAACVADRRAADRRQPEDLLDELIAGSTDEDLIVATMRMALFASHGVPGTALTWIVLRLAAEPELAAAISDESRAGSDGLPLATAFVKETLRLHPPQWLLTRTALRPTEVGGYRIRSGEQVLVCPFTVHRDERYWPRPDRFDPGRWLTGRTPHPPNTYLPFGAGPRICPGSALAMRLLTVLTTVLASRHAIRAPHPEAVAVMSDGLLRPESAVGGWDSLG
ncbi:cytochrome P450 [Kutzneria sp. NPDC052558]|uniref:cytochrome P450 n=1 Tax=Kutzneria sp. NPDC052558 TaxID=3364121 RepID=UPI0037C69197